MPSASKDAMRTDAGFFVVITVPCNSPWNAIKGELLRGAVGIALSLAGICRPPRVPYDYPLDLAAAWTTANPLATAAKVKSFLRSLHLLRWCHIAWLDESEGIFREVNTPDGKAFADRWNEAEAQKLRLQKLLEKERR